MVAETFGKRHDNVLRDIKELECSEEFSLLNFEETPYTAQNGQNYVKYLITRDGFTFLVMGYTGKEAARLRGLHLSIQLHGGSVKPTESLLHRRRRNRSDAGQGEVRHTRNWGES